MNTEAKNSNELLRVPQLCPYLLLPVMLSHLSEEVCSLWPSLLTSVHVESLLAVTNIPHQDQLHLCLGFPNLISSCLDSIPVFFISDTSLFPLPVHALLFSPFDKLVLAEPWFTASSACFSVWGDTELLCSQKGIFKG